MTAVAVASLTPGRDVEEQSQLDICLDFDLNLGSKRACNEVRNTSPSLAAPERRRPKIDLGLSLSSTVAAESDVTSVTLASSPVQNGVEIPASSDIVQLLDEGSTSSKSKKSSIVALLDGLLTTEAGMLLNGHFNIVNPAPAVSNVSSISIESQHGAGPSGTSHSKPPRKSAVKTCQYPDCMKGARGASGRCISHGGGCRCQRPGCQKGQKARLQSARPMLEADGVNIWAAPKVPRAERISALAMGVDGGAVSKEAALVLPGGSLGCASGVAGARGARLRTAQRVLVFVLAMEVAGVAKLPSVPKMFKGALNSARPMVEERGAP